MPQHAQQIDVQELAKMSFLKGAPLDGRIIAATSYYEDGKPLYGMLNPSTGELNIMPNTTACWGAYWSDTLIDADQDTCLPLLDTLAQHFTFPTVVHSMRGVELDLGNLTTVIEKFMAIHDYHMARPKADTAVRLMYLTELEYFFGVCRSLIDLLHDCYRHLHSHYGGTELPRTFGKFVDRDVADLVTKYNLPSTTEEYLTKVKPFFGRIRKVRDSIYHHGKSLELIYLTEQGPGICLDYHPFDVFQDMFESDTTYTENMVPTRIGSLFYITLALLGRMIDATNETAVAIEKAFSPAPPRFTKDGYRYFFRGPSFMLLNRRDELLSACWLGPARQLAAPHLDSRTPLLASRTAPSVDDSAPGQTPVIAETSEMIVPTRTNDRDKWIAENAYYRWLNEQQSTDRSCQHWYDAEREYICSAMFGREPLSNVDVGKANTEN